MKQTNETNKRNKQTKQTNEINKQNKQTEGKRRDFAPLMVVYRSKKNNPLR